MTKVQSKNAILFDIENDAGPLRDVMVATIGEGTTVEPGLISAVDKAKLDGIAASATANATDAALRDRTTHTGEQAIGTITGLVDALAGKATPTDVAVALAGLVDSSPATLDTLNELAAALGDDPAFATTVSTALGNRLRVDAAQGLTAPQQAQGRDNLGLGSAALAAVVDFATAAQGTIAETAMQPAAYDPQGKGGDPFPYDTVAAVGAKTVSPGIDTIDLRGHTTAGDLGGFKAARVGSEPLHDAWVQDAAGVYFVNIEPKLDIRQFGVVGSDNEGALVDESENITKAITAAIALRRPLILPATNYLFGGISFADAFNLAFENMRGEIPVFHGTQALADAAGRLLRFNRTAYDVDAGAVYVTANITPGQKKITLSSTSALEVGMMIEIISNQLWYYDPRGVDTCGEMHEISRIVSATEIEVWDFTRDFYDIATDTLTVRAYWPDTLEMEPVELVMPAPATSVSTCCLQTDRLFRPRLNGVIFRGATFCGWLNQRSWQGKHTELRCQDIGRAGSVGYGVSDRSSVGSHYDGLRGHAMRRLIDFEGVNGMVNRDGLVKNFEIFGGGVEFDGAAYFPDGAQPNYGVGMHGPCEGARFIDGIIADVEEGVKVRGRGTEIRGVKFLGKLVSCISAIFGTGLVVENNQYDRYDFPDKVASGSLDDNAQAQNFIKFGISAGTGDWNWGAPASIKNNVANGLRNSFVWFASSGGTVSVTNLDCQGNTVVINRPVATNFEFYKADGTARIASSKIGPNKVINQGGGTYDIYPSSLSIANVSQVGADGVVETGDNEYLFTLPKDTYAVIRDVSKQAGDRVGVLISDQNGNVYGHFILLSATAMMVSLGAISASIVATETGSALTGTAGVDGNFTVGLTNGDLFMENRTGASRRLRARLF